MAKPTLPGESRRFLEDAKPLTGPLEILNCTKEDFDQILLQIEEFWGDDRTLHLHHPMFLYEFGNTAFIIKEDQKVIAYLFGFMSQTAPAGYVHLVAVRQTHQGRGLARLLYKHFIEHLRKQGCTEIKAITTPANKQSIAFHQSLGMELLGQPDDEGVPVMKDYSGPGQHRVVFRQHI